MGCAFVGHKIVRKDVSGASTGLKDHHTGRGLAERVKVKVKLKSLATYRNHTCRTLRRRFGFRNTSQLALCHALELTVMNASQLSCTGVFETAWCRV